MNPKQDRKWRSALGLAVALFSGGLVRAQEPDAARLDALLGQLQQTDAKAWQARADAMKTAATEARTAAAARREAAKTKEQAALAEAEAGKTLAAEIDKLARVRTALAELQFRDPAGSGDAKNSGQGRLEIALLDLQRLEAAAWEARSQAMRRAVAAHDERAKELRQDSKELIAEAEAKSAMANMLDAELGKLEQLRQLIASLSPSALATATAPKSAPDAKPAPPASAKPMAAPAKAPPAEKPPASEPTKPKTDGNLVTYAEHVQPIFDAHCFDCHGRDDPSGGLDLSTHAATLQGGSSGRTLVPGNPDESRLYLLVAHKEKPTMPKDAPRLDGELIETIRNWIAGGAPKDEADAAKIARAREAANAKAAKAAAEREDTKLAVQAVMPDEHPAGPDAVRKSYPPHPAAMRTVAASPGAPLLAVPGCHQVLLLHQDDLRELAVLDFPFGQVEVLAFSADGTTLLAAGGIPAQKGGAVLYDVRSGRALGRFGEQRDVVMAAAVSPRADLIAVGGTGRVLEVLRSGGSEPAWQHTHEDWVTAATFSTDGKLLASADRQGSVHVREAWNGREVHVLKAADGLLAGLAFAPDSASLATAGADRSVCLFRISDGRRLFRQQAHTDQALCIVWRTDKNLCTSGADGRVLHWRTNGNRESELPRLGEWVYGIAASADGASVFTADWKGRLTAIDVKTGKVRRAVTPLAALQ